MDSSSTLARALKGRKTVNKKVAVRRVTAARGCVCVCVCDCVTFKEEPTIGKRGWK